MLSRVLRSISSSSSAASICFQEEGEETTDGNDDDDTAGVAADEAKLSDIYGRLGQIGAASAEARAATILSGLGFSTDVQVGV